MNRIVRIFARARADIEEIFNWLERRSPPGAATWYYALLRSLERIAQNPDRHSIIAEATPRWHRKILQALFKTRRGRRYRVVFEVTEAEIRILRIRGPGQPPLRGRDLHKT
jgi:plasmid stabilization system protein ParE